MRQVLIVLLISFSTTALGQNHFVGMQAGLIFSNLTANEIFDNSGTRTGLIGGLTYGLKLSNGYRFETDILYSQQGFTDKFILTDKNGMYIGEENTEMNYDYLSIPIKIRYEMGNKIKIIPKIGIVPALPVAAESVFPEFDDTGKLIGLEITDHKDYVSEFDLGGLIEAGIESVLSNHIILCSALTYKHSLTTFSNKNYFEGTNMRHYGFSIVVGIKYRLYDK